MNSLKLTDKSKELRLVAAAQAQADQLEEPWFDEAPASSRARPSTPIQVGEFLGDPEVDAWLR
ncbi:MAG: hypothetical protein KIS78_22540 [Labilithrix sp.]|nr:hypothetical protein [Labilithrix sp.]MCW5835196.1 hypothetical protein [Labilithrix sp.]